MTVPATTWPSTFDAAALVRGIAGVTDRAGLTSDGKVLYALCDAAAAGEGGAAGTLADWWEERGAPPALTDELRAMAAR